MKKQSVRYQAAVLTGANALVRAMGFALRITMSRLLGAQALGVMELSHSAHMLLITPVTAGLPTAVSRITAKSESTAALDAGKQLVFRICRCLVPLWLLLSPLIALLLGDTRTLLSLWAFAPCAVVLGLGAVYNGYCYGMNRPWPPALSELMEQIARFALSAALLCALPALTTAARAAVPAVSTLIAESLSLLLVMRLLKAEKAPADAAVSREIVRLALPLTASRLMTTLLRAATNALIPRRLVASGLPMSAAMTALGQLQGMVMPVLFLPGVFTSAIAMVGAPAVARRQGAQLRRMALSLFFSALLSGAGGTLVIRALAGTLANSVYRAPGVRELFVSAAPLTLLFALQQAAGTVMNGLGMQKKTLLPSLAGAALTLYLVFTLSAMPELRIHGAVAAMACGQSLTVLWQLLLCFIHLRPAAGSSAMQPNDS